MRHANQPRKRDENEVVEEAVPRLFQREMLQLALKENVVFHAPTVRFDGSVVLCVGLRASSVPALSRKSIALAADFGARDPAKRTSRRCSSATS